MLFKSPRQWFFLVLTFSLVAVSTRSQLGQSKLWGAEEREEPGTDLTKTEIDRREYSKLLADLQGNILEDHGKEHAVLVFLEFHSDSSAARKWIRDFAKQYVVSAAEQHKAELFAGFYLSRRGYGALEFSRTKLPRDEYFRVGMKDEENRKNLGDPQLAQWEVPYQKQIDALILLAHNQRAELQKAIEAIEKSVDPVADLVESESISRLRNREGQEIEHFGFRDGISQPLFLKDQLRKVQRKSYDPSAPLKLAILKDRLGKHEWSCGSYLVVRKLHENVARFNEQIKMLASKFGISPALAEAYVMGRFKDGTPVHSSPRALGAEKVPNDFTFATDKSGTKCPIHAHIRKTNPRGSSKDTRERAHRIVRRAMMYGVDEAGKPNKDGKVGMMFLCFQGNITEQFAFQQSRWANTPVFPRSGSGRDPIIGQVGKPASGQPTELSGDNRPKYPKSWGKPGVEVFQFCQCVTMKGGEYFFAPSISFLLEME